MSDKGSKEQPPGERLVLRQEMQRLTGGLSYPTIWGMMRRGEFPVAVVVGGKSAWIFSEIQEWMASLPRRKYKPPPDEPQDDEAKSVAAVDSPFAEDDDDKAAP